MKVMKQMKNVMLTLALAFVMTLAFSVTAKAAPVTPAQVTGLTQTGYNSNTVKVEWTAQLTNNVDYEVYISTDGVTWGEPRVSSTYGDNWEMIYNLNAGTTYYVKVRAYTKEYNSTIRDYEYAYGADSAILEVVTSPNSAPSYLKKTDSTTTTMKVEWAAVPGANAYWVSWKKSGSTTWKDTFVYSTNPTKVTTTLKGLTKNSEYDVQVNATRVNSTKTFKAISSNYKYEYGYGVTPSKVTGVSVPYYWESLSEIKVTYNTIPCEDGHQTEVWTAYKKKDTKVASSTDTYVKKSALKNHKFFKVRVRAYTETSNGTKKYGAWSDWKYVCQQPTVTSMKSSGKGMTIKYDKIDGADRYVIYMSTKQKSGYKKIATTTKTSYTVTKFNKKKLVNGKKYYVYVVAYNKVGKKYYSGEAGNATWCWSNTYYKN